MAPHNNQRSTWCEQASTQYIPPRYELICLWTPYIKIRRGLYKAMIEMTHSSGTSIPWEFNGCLILDIMRRDRRRRHIAIREHKDIEEDRLRNVQWPTHYNTIQMNWAANSRSGFTSYLLWNNASLGKSSDIQPGTRSLDHSDALNYHRGIN